MNEECQVLIVDDSSFFRSMLSDLLSRQEISCALASDGVEALEVLKTVSPKVILSDWMMPGIDGLELCVRLRESEEHKQCYFILLTSRDEVEDAVRGLEKGADEFINKGVDPREIAVRVKVGLRIADLYESLRDAERKLTVLDLATTLGHEINNPLQVVTGFAELISKDPEVPERRRKNAKGILEAAHRIQVKVKQVKDIKDPKHGRYLDKIGMIELEDDKNEGSEK
jgi:CheY-like chemotaxis protein